MNSKNKISQSAEAYINNQLAYYEKEADGDTPRVIFVSHEKNIGSEDVESMEWAQTEPRMFPGDKLPVIVLFDIKLAEFLKTVDYTLKIAKVDGKTMIMKLFIFPKDTMWQLKERAYRCQICNVAIADGEKVHSDSKVCRRNIATNAIWQANAERNRALAQQKEKK